MRRLLIAFGITLFIQLPGAPVFAQQDKLAGKWEGKMQSPQGERATTATFKKEGETYTGFMTGLRPGSEIQLKDIKIEGNKVTAKADVETPQGALAINYTFTLDGATMKGQGTLDFGGQTITLDIDLKRSSAETQAVGSTGQQQGQTQGPGQRQRNPDAPQPKQKQSIDYFAGKWGYKFIGRESAFGPAPRDCTVTFTKRPDGKSVDGVTECKYDGGAYKESSVIVFDEATKALTTTEKLNSGTTLNTRGDWTSPISIRYTIDPVKIKGQALQLRRTVSIVAAHSFTVAEELSENGGPFVRLGSAVFSRVGSQ